VGENRHARHNGPEAAAAGVTAAGWRNDCSAGPPKVTRAGGSASDMPPSEALAQRLARRSRRPELPQVSQVFAARLRAWRVYGGTIWHGAQRTAAERSAVECSAMREHRVSSSSRRVLAQREGHRRPRSPDREGPRRSLGRHTVDHPVSDLAKGRPSLAEAE
jgi:hypothetical protein